MSLLKAERTPDRPGPGPLPEGLLRALDIDIGRRMEGMLAGDYRALLHGDGTELAQIRPYVPGDDVRRIDWNVTARTGQPHVREHLAERVLVTWLVLDTSPSMQFGTADRRKADVAEGVAIALGHVATRRGNRLGVVTFGDDRPRSLPARQGRMGLIGLLAALRAEPPEERVGATSLGEALTRAGALARQRSLVVVVSDFRGPRDWRRPLLELAGRHDVLAVEIRDQREQELPNVGELWLVDPETGGLMRVNTRSKKLRTPLRRRGRRGTRRAREGLHLGRCASPRPHDLGRLASLAGGLPQARRQMSFERPLALAALVLIPLIVGIYFARERRRTRFAARWGSPALLPNLVDRSPGKLRYLPIAILLVALAAMIVGVARPHAVVSVPREEATVVLALDVSRSMKAEDVEPTRLEAAKAAAKAFLPKVPEKFRVGVVSFASRANVAMPPTEDRTLVESALDSLKPGEGTAVGDAIALATELGRDQRAEDGSRPPERCC